MAIVFSQGLDGPEEDVSFAVIDDPRYRWIGKMRIGFSINGGAEYMCRSHHPVRENNFHMDLIIPSVWLDEITDTTIDDILIEWSGYNGRN